MSYNFREWLQDVIKCGPDFDILQYILIYYHLTYLTCEYAHVNQDDDDG